MNDKQTCPVCGNEVHKSERYPSYVCAKDVARATDSSGRPVSMFNEDMDGGFLAKYADGSAAAEVVQTHEVYIDSVKYHADEAHFGGIVVTAIPPK